MMKKLVVAVAVLAGLSTGALAQQDYPNRIIKITQGFPPGGNVDIIARILGHEMEKSARPVDRGRGQARPRRRACRRRPSRAAIPTATRCWCCRARIRPMRALSKNVKFKVVDDFTWISVASFYPFMICVKADSRFQTLKQLIDEARAKPGELKYGSAGVGSILHTTVELIGNQTKTKFLHVPYRGEAPAITGVLHRRHRLHRRHHRADQRAREVGRVPRAGGDRQDALARFPQRADRR